MTQPLEIQPAALSSLTSSPSIAHAPIPLKSDHQEAKSFDLGATINLSIALIAVSFAAIFMRYSEVEISANSTVFCRFLVFTLAFGTIRAIGKLREYWNRKPEAEVSTAPPISTQQWILLGSVGAIATASLVLWAMSLTRTSVANSVLLNNLTPLFTTLGGWLFLGQRFDRRFLIGLGIALIGAFSLGASDLHLGGITLIGDAYALLSAVFLAAYFLLAERLRDRFSATTILLWRCSVGMLILVPLIITTEGVDFLPKTVTSWGSVIALGIICEGLGQRLLAKSFEKFSSSFISLFLLLEPPLSALFAWFIFSEKMGISNLISFVLVTIGLYIAKFSNPTSNEAEPAH
jgi:drug/metabolite transporter (DMT)-like permease